MGKRTRSGASTGVRMRISQPRAVNAQIAQVTRHTTIREHNGRRSQTVTTTILEVPDNPPPLLNAEDDMQQDTPTETATETTNDNSPPKIKKPPVRFHLS